MASDPLKTLSLLLESNLSVGVRDVLRQVSRDLAANRPFDLQLIDGLIAATRERVLANLSDLSSASFQKFLGTGEDVIQFGELRELIRERVNLLDQNIRNYRFLVNESAQTSLTIGRRGQDVLRNMSLEKIEKGFWRGDPGQFVSDTFKNSLNKRAEFVSNNVSTEELFKLRKEFFDKIPVFHKSGQPHFFLLDRNNKFRAFKVSHYADLIAVTTVDEARTEATKVRAKRLNTRFIKYSKGPKSRAEYLAEGDYICAAIDDRIFSLTKETQKAVPVGPNGETRVVSGAVGKSGKFYPAVSEVINAQTRNNKVPNGFNRPHPFCRHQPRPIAERFV